MLLNIVDAITNWFKPVSDWIGEHNNSWFFWIGLLLLFLFIFGVVLEALNRNKH